MNMMIMIIQFNSLLIYVLSSTASGRLQSARIQTAAAIRQHRKKHTTNNKNKNEFRLLILNQDFLKMSLSLQTAFAVEIHLADGQWLEEQVNMLKLRMFRV
jgi:hypothetical protein